MALIIAVVVSVVLIVWFVIYPIILLFQCLFDAAVAGGIKILVFITSLFMFPIPSFCYGAFVKRSVFCSFMLCIYLCFFVIGIAIGLVVGIGGVIDFIEDKGINVPGIEHRVSETPQSEVRYKGYNTYDTDEVNVFESSEPVGKGAQ